MIKLSKKSLLLFVSAIAMAAFAMPSLASAATFDGVGNHSLTSSDLLFNAPTLGPAGSTCTSSNFTANVATGGATASVTAATFSGCTGTGILAGVPATVTVTNLPWAITRTALNTFTIDGIHVVVHFPAAGVTVTLAGNLAGGKTDCPSGTVTLNGATGLTATSSTGGSGAATVTGHFTDDQHSLCVT